MLCSVEVIQQVWEKGIVTTNNDPKYWRRDQCGAWIARTQYGCQQSPFGWEINYIHPQTDRGGQDLVNLRPMQWKNNTLNQDGDAVCVLKAVGVQNCDVLSGTPMVNKYNL